MDSKTGRDILVIKPGSLGDIIHALPVIQWLKAGHPQSRIHWIADTRWASILEGHPDLERIITFPRSSFRGALGALRFVSWLNSLRGIRPSITIDLQGLLRSALMGRCSCPERIVGGSDAREGATWFYSTTAKVDPQKHAVERYRAIAAEAGAGINSTPEFKLPETPLPKGFSTENPFLLLHPFARGEGKSLDVLQVDTLLRLLHPARVVLIGQCSDEVANRWKFSGNWLNRTTLPELAALCRTARFSISVDSGPAHLASVLTPGSLAIHTWSDPRRVGPWPKEAWVWRAGHLSRQRDFPVEACSCPGQLPGDVALKAIAQTALREMES
jgi:heptosyltransferase-1